jgi:hypothetical protein
MDRGRDKFGWERLGDVQVPKGILWFVFSALLFRQRRLNTAIDEFGERASELGTYLGTSWRESDEREARLVELQESVENLTRWLVRFTIVLGVVGIASIAVTIWATLR